MNARCVFNKSRWNVTSYCGEKKVLRLVHDFGSCLTRNRFVHESFLSLLFPSLIRFSDASPPSTPAPYQHLLLLFRADVPEAECRQQTRCARPVLLSGRCYNRASQVPQNLSQEPSRINIVSQVYSKDKPAIMKFHGLLGYTFVFWIANLFVKEHACEITQNSNNVNVTLRIDPSITVNDDDDFVPYQGQRFNVFDWMLFKKVGKNHSGNVLISPISIKLALVLLYEGAQDETAYELSNVMQLPVSRPATRDKFSNILRSLQTPSTIYTLNIGTRLYIDSNVLTRQRYQAILKTFYDTDVVNTDMSEVHSVTEDINSWVRNITNGNIGTMIEDERSIKDSVMLIMNTLFFKGTWRHKYFSPENTQLAKFYTNTNESIYVPFMHTVSRLYYAVSPELNAKILRIPYEGQKFAMYIILPYTVDGVDRLIENIDPFILTRYVWLMQDLPIDLVIPKFKFEFSTHFESVLRELGIQHIFDDTAALTGIARAKRTSRRLRVSDILQKTGVEVNENGTAAYAATEVQVGNKIEDETFHATHPFLFYIEDETTGTILYMGKVMNPLEKTGSIEGLYPEVPTRIGEDTPNTGRTPK